MKFPIVQVLFLCVGFYAVNSSVNVAFHKPAWLSSTWNWKSKAENIVDGTKYTDDDDAFFNRCVHTNTENFPRWWVNLTGDYTIARIDIDYRRDTRHRMFGYKLIVSDTEDRRRWNSDHQIEGHLCRDETRRNPPVQQTVPCLARGRYITYADNEDDGDPNPYVELCEIEAYGCPTGWFGQDNCLEQCPDGCRDTVCNPDNGTCFAGCESGLRGDICDTACPIGTFGINCTGECFCKNGTCDPTNGVCPGNACDRGWNGPSCSSQCDPGSFGYNCDQSCNCQTASCNRTTGQCPPGGSKDGWRTDNCSQKHQYEVNGSQDSLANTKCIIGYAILGTVLAISVFYNIGLTVFCLRQSRRIKTPPKSATAHEMQPISVSQDNSNYDGLDTTKVDNVKNIYETIGK